MSEEKQIKQLSTILYITEGSESISRSQKECDIDDPSDEEALELITSNIKQDE